MSIIYRKVIFCGFKVQIPTNHLANPHCHITRGTKYCQVGTTDRRGYQNR